MFMNYMLDASQSDFNQNSNPSGIVVQFCDKAGEICGSWFVLSSFAGIKVAAEIAYTKACSYYVRQKAPQLIAERVAVSEGTIIAADALAGSATGQLIKEEIACLTNEGMKFGEGNLIQNVPQLERTISEWLGEGTRLIKNKNSDSVLLSLNKTKRVRFDFIKPNLHNNPHMHLEEFINNEWIGSRIYPKDVPHN
jgi:hypothetical protein